MRIELQNVNVDLGEKSILRDINLDFSPGQITSILGRSGCGLSVLLKTAAGLIQPSSGEVLYDGVAYRSLGEKERSLLQTRTGFMFQDAALWANMSLAANLDLPLQAKFPKLTGEARRQIVADALEELGVPLDLKKRPVELSLGGQKFASFLRAVISDPEALFLDEPIAWLDHRWAEIIRTKLAELRSRGVLIVLGSHNSHLTLDLSDRLVCLQHGEVLATGDSHELSNSSHPEIQLILEGQITSSQIEPGTATGGTMVEPQ